MPAISEPLPCARLFPSAGPEALAVLVQRIPFLLSHRRGFSSAPPCDRGCYAATAVSSGSRLSPPAFPAYVDSHLRRHGLHPGTPFRSFASSGSPPKQQEEQQETSTEALRVAKAIKSAPYIEPTWGQRFATIRDATVNGTKAVVGFVVSVPGRIQRFAALPAEERRARLHKIWVSIKEVR